MDAEKTDLFNNALLGSYREFLWTPLPSPTFSLLTGQWLDFHQLADYHASRTTVRVTGVMLNAGLKLIGNDSHFIDIWL
jgi:hypothetical protein